MFSIPLKQPHLWKKKKRKRRSFCKSCEIVHILSTPASYKSSWFLIQLTAAAHWAISSLPTQGQPSGGNFFALRLWKGSGQCRIGRLWPRSQRKPAENVAEIFYLSVSVVSFNTRGKTLPLILEPCELARSQNDITSCSQQLLCMMPLFFFQAHQPSELCDANADLQFGI